MRDPLPFNERPSFSGLERSFCRRNVPSPEGLTNFEHWALARQHIQEMHGRSLADDFGDIYAKIERDGHGTRLLAACNLALLQYLFWHFLYHNGRVQRHQFVYWANVASTWNIRLGARLGVVKGYRRNENGALKKARVPAVARADVH